MTANYNGSKFRLLPRSPPASQQFSEGSRPLSHPRKHECRVKKSRHRENPGHGPLRGPGPHRAAQSRPLFRRAPMLTRSSNLRSLLQRSQPEGFRFVSYPLIRSTNVGNICSYAHQYPRSTPRILVLHRGPFDLTGREPVMRRRSSPTLYG